MSKGICHVFCSYVTSPDQDSHRDCRSSSVVSSNTGWQSAYGRASLLVGGDQIELRLQVQPELRLYAEPVSKPQGRIARHRPLARNDLANAVRRHIDLACKRRGRDAHLFKLVLQDFTGMYSVF